MLTALVLMFLMLGVIAFQPAAASSSDDWPMFQHDLNHSGSSSSYGPTTNQTLWNYTTGGGVTSSPAVVGGVVYVGSGDRNVYALNAGTGAKIWNYATGGPVQSSPAVADGVVYVGSGDRNVYAIGANASAPAPSSPTPVESISAPPTSTPTPTSTPSTTPSPSIPEFPSWMILPLCAVAAFAAVVVVWRKRKQKT